LREAGIAMEVEEEGQSFRENAIAKARAYVAVSGLLTLADDSGLEVEALGGEPGVRSSRYAGVGAPNEERIALLLSRMRGIPWERRVACFRCVIAIAHPQGDLWVCEGECSGFITFTPAGSHGFGYDSVFYLPEFGMTMAELPPFKKNQISHRAQACRAARRVLLEVASAALP
jgi:XTP/dITP diphosphohydrolase